MGLIHVYQLDVVYRDPNFKINTSAGLRSACTVFQADMLALELCTL